MSQIRQFDWVPEEELAKGRTKRNRAYFEAGEALFCISSVNDDETKEVTDEDGHVISPSKPKFVFNLDVVQTLSNGETRTGTFKAHVVKSKNMAWLLRNILNSVGSNLYKPGGFKDEEVVHKNGKLVFEVEESEKYGAQNRVSKWIPYVESSKSSNFSSGLPVDRFDDDIPF